MEVSYEIRVEQTETCISNEEVNGPKVKRLNKDANLEKAITFGEEAIKAVAWGALCGGAWGLAFGVIAGTPLLLTIGLFAADNAVTRATRSVVNSLKEAYELKNSTVGYIEAAAVAVISTAFIVTGVSMGIFGSMAIGFFAASALRSILNLTLSDEQLAAKDDIVDKRSDAFFEQRNSEAMIPTLEETSAGLQKEFEKLQVVEPQVEDVTDLDPTLEGSRL